MPKTMRKLPLLILSATLGMQLHAQQNPASVFLTAGQSNADGRAYLSEGLPSYMQDGYKHLRFANVTSATQTTFYDRTFDGTQEGGRFAFSDVTNYYIDQGAQSDFYCIKCAFGGTAIAMGQNQGKLPCWNASEAYTDTARAYRGSLAHGTSLAKSLTEGFGALAHNVLSKLSQGYDVKAIMWHQGEGDRKAGTAYYGNLKSLITFIRTEVYKVTGDKADLRLPFIMGTMPHSSRQYNAAVEAAQKQLAQDMPNVYTLDLSNADLRSDNIHLNAQRTELFGIMVYSQLVEIGAVEGRKIEAAAITTRKPSLASSSH